MGIFPNFKGENKKTFETTTYLDVSHNPNIIYK